MSYPNDPEYDNDETALAMRQWHAVQDKKAQTVQKWHAALWIVTILLNTFTLIILLSKLVR